jgi:hypothetical protein
MNQTWLTNRMFPCLGILTSYRLSTIIAVVLLSVSMFISSSTRVANIYSLPLLLLGGPADDVKSAASVLIQSTIRGVLSRKHRTTAQRMVRDQVHRTVLLWL